jgi:hypothetical protein
VTYSKATLFDLKRSGLTAADARALQIKELSIRRMRLKKPRGPRCTGYLIPYFDFEGNPLEHWRIRFHKEQLDSKSRPQRYTQKWDSGVRLYIPPNYDWSAMPETISVTEGEKKGAAACAANIACLALGGVYMFGSKKRGIKLLPELVAVAPKIKLEIVFDAENNPHVEAAQRLFAARMHDAGTKDIVFVQLPPEMKFDDFLAQYKTPAAARKAYKELPRHPFTLRDHCEAVRLMPQLTPRVRHQQIFELIRADLDLHCTAHRVPMQHDAPDKLYIFDKRLHRLFPFDEPKDSSLLARMNELYGTNGSEPEYSWLHYELHSHLTRTGKVSAVHEFATSRNRGKVVYIYAGDNEVFRVTCDGAELVHNGYNGVLFRNTGLSEIELADSADHTAMDLLTGTPNFKISETLTAEQMQMLFELWIWSLLFPSRMATRCLLLLYGDQGSFKTSALRRVLQTLFGMRADVSIFEPKRIDALIVILSTAYLAVLDNVDGAHPGIENHLATACTGGQNVERTLYVNGRPCGEPLDAFVAVTSRDPQPFRRPDLVARLLLLTVETSETFDGESEIKADTARNRPKFWRYVLDTLPAVIEALTNYEPEPVEYRLADFANFCLAVGPVLGYKRKDIRAALNAHESGKAEFAIEVSTLPEAIIAALKVAAIQDMPVRELLAALQKTSIKFPFKNPRALGAALRWQTAGLRSCGIAMASRKGAAKQTFYTLEMIPAKVKKAKGK